MHKKNIEEKQMKVADYKFNTTNGRFDIIGIDGDIVGHRTTEMASKEAVANLVEAHDEALEEVYDGTIKEILEDISEGKGPKQYKLYLGHAGWSAGQLEQEIERGDWLLQSVTRDFVFNVPEKYMWTQANKTFGIDTTQITGLGGSA